MDGRHDGPHRGFREAVLRPFPHHVGQELLPSARLEDGHVVVFLVLAYLPAHIHPVAEELEEVLVQQVYPGAKGVDSLLVGLVVGAVVPDDQALQKLLQRGGGELLLGVAQGAGRVAVALYHEPVQTQVHGPLGKFLQVLAVPRHVGRVGEEGQLRVTGTQFDGDLPARVVAVGDGGRGGKAPVNHAQFPDAGPVQALQGADPQVQVRIHGVLHQHGHIGAAEGIGNLLHQEGVGRRTGTYPHHVHAVFDALQHMLLRSHFGADLHAQLFLHPLKPFEAGGAHALEAARMRPGLPDTCTEYVDAEGRQAAGRFHHLFFSFRTAGACNAHGPGKGEEAPPGSGDDIQFVCHYLIIFLIRLASSMSARMRSSS